MGKKKFDPLLALIYPVMIVNAICAFLFVLAANMLEAVYKTFKGETVK